MHLAAWVRAARQHGNMTMQQLADHLSLTKGAIYHWEHGNNNPSFDQMARIADLTGHPMPTIVPGPDAPKTVQDLSGNEGLLVGLYRTLNPEDRQRLMHQMQERAAHYKLTARTPDEQQ